MEVKTETIIVITKDIYINDTFVGNTVAVVDGVVLSTRDMLISILREMESDEPGSVDDEDVTELIEEYLSYVHVEDLE